MDVIEKFLHEVSWKFDKGYPDITNEQDILMLERLLGENGIKINLDEIGEDRGEIVDDIEDLRVKINSHPEYESNQVVGIQQKSPKTHYWIYIDGIPSGNRETRRDVILDLQSKVNKNMHLAHLVNLNKSDVLIASLKELTGI